MDYKRDPNIKALKRAGLINHESTLFIGFLETPEYFAVGLQS